MGWPKSNGFIQSNIDPCLFSCSDCILMIYTDDCLIFGTSDSKFRPITTLQQMFLMKDVGKVKDFLASELFGTCTMAKLP